MTTLTAELEQHRIEQNNRISKAKRNRRILFAIIAGLLLLPVILIAAKPSIMAGLAKLGTQISNGWIWLWIACIALSIFIFKTFKKVATVKQSGFANILIIYAFDIIIRFIFAKILILLIVYVFENYIGFSPIYYWWTWVVPGTILEVTVGLGSVYLFIVSIDSTTVGKEDLGQLMFFEQTPIPVIGNNLIAFPIPLLPWFSLEKVRAAPSPVNISKKVDNQGRPAIELALKESKDSKHTRQFLIEFSFSTGVSDTYAALKFPIAETQAGDFAISALIPKLQAYSFEELKNPEKDGSGKTLLERIRDKGVEELDANLRPHGFNVAILKITDPVEPEEVLKDRTKVEREVIKGSIDQVNTKGINDRAIEIMELAEKTGEPITFSQARQQALIDEGIIKADIQHINQKGGGGKNGEGGGPVTVFFDGDNDNK